MQDNLNNQWVTYSQLLQDLKRIGLKPNDVIMLHASVKAIGQVANSFLLDSSDLTRFAVDWMDKKFIK